MTYSHSQLEFLKKDLAFAIWALRQFKQQPMKSFEGAMYLKVFENSHVPDSFVKDVNIVDTDLMELAIPELATMYEIKVLEYQKEMAEKRLAEIRGTRNG